MESYVRLSLLCTLFATTALGNTPPVIDANPANGVAPVFPVGKTLILPITATDADAGDTLTYKVTSNNPKMIVRVKTGNPMLRVNVNYGAPEPGVMEFLLFREWTPITAAFMGGFAQAGFFDNVKFHRVIKNFVIQGGDPLGTGQGGPGMIGGAASTAFKFETELQPGLHFTGKGQLAMANAGYATDYSATNGSQFFVTLEQLHVPTSAHGLSLDFKHTIFGQMLRGWDVLDAIANLDPDGDSVPTPNVVMTTAIVVPNTRDAVLMLSATGRVPANAPATITVTADDGHGGVTTKTFSVSTVDDGYNSPPVVLNLPPMTAPKETQYNFGLQYFDMEADYLFLNHGLLGTSALNAASTSQGFTAAIRGDDGYQGQIRIGFEISQFNPGVGSSDEPIVQTATTIGIGDLPLRSEPVTVKALPAAQFSGVVARYKDLDPAATAADYTTPATNTKINWGDGTPVENGTVVRDTSVPGSGNFAVTGVHTYAKAGIYTIVVSATGTKGVVGVSRNQAIVSAGPIVAAGEQLEVKGAKIANRILATFSDSNAPGRPADYTATVDWGDGQSSKGVITKLADKSFVVRGTHTYKDAEPFAVSVQIVKTGGATATAWSTVIVYGFTAPKHLPPFPMAHLVGAWNSGPSKTVTSATTGAGLDQSKLTETLAGAFVVINSGTKASPVSKLRYYLSREPLAISSFSVASPTVVTTTAAHNLVSGEEVSIAGVIGGTFSSAINGTFSVTVVDATHFTVPVACTVAPTAPGNVFARKIALAGATPLKVNALPEIAISGFGPGAGGQGNFTIALPKGQSGAGKYLLAELVYSDPIIDASKVDKVVISGPVDPAIIIYDIVSPLGQGGGGQFLTSEDQTKPDVTFKVVLDTPPAAGTTVTIPVESSVVAEGTVSPASLVFTPANWNVGQTVTVSGVDDAADDNTKTYTVTLKTPTTTDSNYNGLPAIPINFANLDNE